MKDSPFAFMTIILVATLTNGASEIYAPSLPSMTDAFATTIDMAQWSMAIYLVGVSMTQLFYGPISDMVGRRPPMIFGFIIFLLGTLICLFAPSITILIAGRFIQGIGAGAASGLWRAAFRDMYSGPKLAEYAAYITVVISVVFPMAPALGGFLQEFFGWKGSFVFMALYSIVSLFFLVVLFKETNKNLNPDKITVRGASKTYWSIARNPVFSGGAFLSFLAFGGIFSAAATGPVLLIHLLGMSAQNYGIVTFLTACVAMSAAGWLGGRFVGRYGMTAILRFASVLTILSGALLGGTYFFLGLHTLSIVLCLFLYYFAAAFIFPNAFATAFSCLKKNIGYGGALYGFIQMAGGAVLGALTSYLPDTTPLPLAFTLIGCGLTSLLVYNTVVVPKLPKDTHSE